MKLIASGLVRQRKGWAEPMLKPVFRNPDEFQVDPMREYLRGSLPSGPQGCVLEDLDLCLRLFGPKFGSDAEGRFILVEVKYSQTSLGASKERTFGLLDSMLQTANPFHDRRYGGFYVLRHRRSMTETWEPTDEVSINGQVMSVDKLCKWLQSDWSSIAPLWGAQVAA